MTVNSNAFFPAAGRVDPPHEPVRSRLLAWTLGLCLTGVAASPAGAKSLAELKLGDLPNEPGDVVLVISNSDATITYYRVLDVNYADMVNGPIAGLQVDLKTDPNFEPLKGGDLNYGIYGAYQIYDRFSPPFQNYDKTGATYNGQADFTDTSGTGGQGTQWGLVAGLKNGLNDFFLPIDVWFSYEGLATNVGALTDTGMFLEPLRAEAIIQGVSGASVAFSSDVPTTNTINPPAFDFTANTGSLTGTAKLVWVTFAGDPSAAPDGSRDKAEFAKELGTIELTSDYVFRLKPPVAANQPPVADFVVSPENPTAGQEITLDGSRSSDPDSGSEALTYRWTVSRPKNPDNEVIKVTGPQSAQARFTPQAKNGAQYQVTLVVSDGTDDSPPKTVLIDVGAAAVNLPPTITSTSQSPSNPVAVDTEVTLTGQAKDLDGPNALQVAWTQVSGPPVNLSVRDGEAPGQLIATFTPTDAGDFVFQLSADDGAAKSDPNAGKLTVTVKGPNQPPIANAGADQNASVGQPVTLSGAASSDPDNGPSALRYQWSQQSPGTPRLVLQNDTTANVTVTAAEAGTYVLQLRVSDGVDQDASVDTVTLKVAGGNGNGGGNGGGPTPVEGNRPPKADAGINMILNSRTADARASVILDGSGSSDPDDGQTATLKYAWTQVDGAEVVLNGADTPKPSFLATGDGVYVFKLTVTDANGAVATSLVRVVVGPSIQMNAPTQWQAGVAQLIGLAFDQLPSGAQAKIQFSKKGGKRYITLGRVPLKAGNFRWRPGRARLTSDGTLRACVKFARKTAPVCDSVSPIVIAAPQASVKSP